MPSPKPGATDGGYLGSRHPVCRIKACPVIWITSKECSKRHTGALLKWFKGAPAVMNQTILLQKLIAIERAIGVASNNTLRDLIYDAEGYILQMQREEVEALAARPEREARQRFHLLREVADGGSPGLGF